MCKQGENKQIYLIIYKAIKFQQRTTTTCLFASLRMHSGKTAELSYICSKHCTIEIDGNRGKLKRLIRTKPVGKTNMNENVGVKLTGYEWI